MMTSTRRSREIRSHFLFKGLAMHGYHELPPNVARQRSLVQQQVQRALQHSLSHLKPRRILDVGTGYGVNVKVLARRFGRASRIWSIDPSVEVLRQVCSNLMKRKYGTRIRFRQAKAEDIPFKAGAFDLVVSSLSLHHLSNPEKGVREMSRVLSRGGMLMIADWRPVKSPIVPHKPKDIPSPTYVTQLVKRLGFSTSLHKGRYWYLLEAVKKS